MRYIHFTTVGKPKVDEEPLVWTADGRPLDLYHESQEHFMAAVQMKRRQEAERHAAGAAAEGSAKKKVKKGEQSAMKFNKLDFFALVIAEKLWKPSLVLRHVQTKASQEVRLWVSRCQEKLPALLKQAKQWDGAPMDAGQEEESKLGLVHRIAG